MGLREDLLGPSYYHHRRLIKQSKAWSADQIRDYQQTRFERAIQRYGDRITRKEDYRRELSRYTRWDIPLLTHDVRTSGTSAEPFRFRADTFARRQKERAYLFDIWAQVGYEPHNLRVGYRDRVDSQDTLVQLNRLENQARISMKAMTEQQENRFRRWLHGLPPFFLHVYPSSLPTFIDLVGEDFFRSLPIRGVLAGSEAFGPGELARFEENFGIRIAHWYGHSEYAALAYHCRECYGFHFFPTYGHVEFLPSDTGDCRRIVATSFNRIGTQFVRYDTGDLAVVSSQVCNTNQFRRVDAIVGRTQEVFLDNSGKMRPLFGYIFGDEKSVLWDQIRDIQVVQERPGSLRVRLVTLPHANRPQIEHYFEQRLPMVRVEFEHVPFIERAASGKRRYFVNAM
jgi:phenylacetate-CoA ligase